jgi:hypothetical protein
MSLNLIFYIYAMLKGKDCMSCIYMCQLYSVV